MLRGFILIIALGSLAISKSWGSGGGSSDEGNGCTNGAGSGSGSGSGSGLGSGEGIGGGESGCRSNIYGANGEPNTDNSSVDTTTTWTDSTTTERICVPSCQVMDISSDTITVQESNCCNITDYPLQIEAVTQELRTECRCGNHSEQEVTGNCTWNLSGLCPNTKYLVQLVASGSSEIKCMHDKSLKTKPAAPTKATWESAFFNETAVELKWSQPICLNGEFVTYRVLHWTESPRPTLGSNTMETQMTLGSLSPKTTYKFQIITCNSVDDKLCSESDTKHVRTKAGEPSEPLKFQSEVRSSSVIKLTWDPPKELGGPEIDGYQIHYRHKGNSAVDTGNRTIEVGNEMRHFEVMGLEPGKTYLFTIRAYHNSGDKKTVFGKLSDEISATTHPSAPSEPRNLVASNITSNEVTLTWEEPEIKNGSIDGYLVTWASLSDGDGIKNITVNLAYYTVHDLLPWKEYNFSVSAFNLLEEEPLLGPPAPVNRRTRPSEPSAPTNLIALAINSSAIQLNWSRPDDPRGPIDCYDIVCRRDENDTEVKNVRLILKPVDVLEDVVSDLHPWTNYTCWIWAVNMDGSEALLGDPSHATTRTRQDRPSVPLNLEVTNRTSREVYLTWEVPEHLNGPLDGYAVSWFPESNTEIQLNFVVNVTSAIVRGLLPWKEYSFFVSAFNNHYEDKEPFEGPSVTVVNTTRPEKPSGPPQELEITHVEAHSLTVTWKAPEEPNGPIHGYSVSLYRNGDDWLSTKKTDLLEMNLTNLEPYRTYTVKVGAFNLDEEEMLKGPYESISRSTSVDAPSVPTGFTCEHARVTEIVLFWQKPANGNGPVDGYIIRWRKEANNSIPDDWQERNITDLKRSEGLEVICDLIAYTRYELRVSAFNIDDGFWRIGESAKISCQTDVAAPGAPTLDVRRVNTNSVELNWTLPEIRNGPLAGYELVWKLKVCSPNSASDCSHSLILERDKDNFVIKELLPWSNYTFGLMAFNRDRNNHTIYSNKTVQERRTHAGVPEYPLWNLTSLKAVDTRIQFFFPKILFQEQQGPIVRYAVIVAGLDDTANISLYHRRQGRARETMETWSQAKNFYPMPPYQASPLSWNPYNNMYDPFHCQDLSEKNDVVGKKCTIGAEHVCNETTPYCNGPLHSGNYYAVKIRGFTEGGWSETHPLEVFVEPSKRESSSSTGVAVGVSLTLILLLVGAVIGAVFMRKKGLWPHKMTTTTTVIRQEDLNTPMTPIPTRRTDTCIRVSAFGSHVAVMLSDSGLKFSQEFEELKAASPDLPNLVANLTGNKPKNRWANILPFDHSRVKLRPISDDQETDYINASYIPGNSCRREYIASQGPLPSTKDDFWRMIWEQNVSMVVMLTLCMERGKAKCEQYWRDDWEPHYHGDDCIKVVKISESILSAYTIRIFDIQMGGHQRSVKHMHFTKWPDFGCPENPEILINFVRAVRDHLPHSRPSPILVHCSAGVGRTGTFIAVDRLMQQVRDKGEYLDVYRMVLEMRDHRCSMVQTEDQYIYIHECVREIIRDEEERAQTPVSNGFEIYSNLNFKQGE